MKLSLFGKKDSPKQLFSHTCAANKTCGICFDLKTDYEIFSIRSTILKRRKCKHLFCVDCICKYVEVQINNNEHKVMCPSPNCFVKFMPKHFQHVLPKLLLVKWENLISEFSNPSGPKVYCPYENCSMLLGKENDIEREFDNSFKCPLCLRIFCAKCKAPWHGGMNCQKFQQSKRNDKNDLDKKNLEFAKRQQLQRCPHCSMYVSRIYGCNYMKCRFIKYPISLANPSSLSHTYV